MFSKFFGNNKLKPADLERLLAQARRHLWRSELLKAKSLFEQVKAEIRAQVQKDSSTAKMLAHSNFEAQLGLWAIRYLQDQNHRSGIQRVLERSNLDADTAYFIAKIFQLREDTSPQALSVYGTLLSFNTSAKLAKRIADLLRHSIYSDSALQLLCTIANQLPDDIELRGRLCHWYLIAGQDEDARELADEIMGLQPKNKDANRCLAVIAERQQDWLKASEHYKVSGDNLRAAIVLAKANEFAEARRLIMLVPLDQRNTLTWLYYHGWITFNQQNYATALNSWHRLMHENPECSAFITDTVQAAQNQMFYRQLTSFEVDIDINLEAIDDSPYQASVALQLGAIKLLKDDNFVEAYSFLQRAARLFSHDVCSVTYLMLAQAAKKDSEAVDRQIYQQLYDHFQDASLFMWLRGLYLLKNGRLTGFKYLQRAYQDGVHKKHVPTVAVAAANWIGNRSSDGETFDITQGMSAVAEFSISDTNHMTTPFQQAALPSYTLQQLENGSEVAWIDFEADFPIEPLIWGRVQAAFYLHNNDWHRAVSLVDGSDTVLTQRVISAALQAAVQQQNWSSAAEYVSRGLEIDPNHANWKKIEQHLLPQRCQLLWQRKQLETLDFALEKEVRSGTADTSIYHGMAVVYTQLAIAKDQKATETENGDAASAFTMAGHRTQSEYTGILEDQAHNDYWQLAIGYWAVALTDESYWEAWATRRGRVMKETISPEQLRELTHKTIPEMLHRYHEDEIHGDSAFSTHHRYYASIIHREIELTRAVRHLKRVAKRERFELPSSFSMFISPLLMKEYGYGSQGREVVARLSELRLSPYEAGLIRTAFSPLSDVKALVSIKAYDMALEALRNLLENKKYIAIHNEVREELCHVLELSAEEAVELERWDDALALTAEGRKLQPMNKEFVRLTSSAAIGWANSRIRKEEYAEAIQKLESVRLASQQRNAELDALLSNAYVEWAYEADREDEIDLAKQRFEQALAMDKDSPGAKDGLRVIHHNKGLEKAKSERYQEAIDDLDTALKYEPDNINTLKLKVSISYDAAQHAISASNAWLAKKHWKVTLETAHKLFALLQTMETLHQYAAVAYDYLIFLYRSANYEDAMTLGDELYRWDYDIDSIIEVHLGQILSAICTDYGANLYNGGNRWRGKQLMQKALQYDPTNQVARKNLYTM